MHEIRIDSDDDLILKEPLLMYHAVILVKPGFHDQNKYHPQIF